MRIFHNSRKKTLRELVLMPIEDRKIRVGFVGCGRVSKSHFKALLELNDQVQVVGITDTDITRATEAAKQFGAKAFDDIEKMLHDLKPDLVAVATPNGMHPKHVMQIAKLGCNVVTEKPMAINWEDGLEMKKVCDENYVKLFVIHQNRFNDTVQALRKAIDAGRFGKIYMITSNVFWQRPQEYYDKDASWHGTKDLDGGAFMTQASHYVDLMQWVAGSQAQNVYANIATLARKIETEDTGMAIINWENGILGSINISMLTYPDNMEGSVTILGEKGFVKIGGVAMNKIEHWEFADNQPQDAEVIKASNYETTSVYGSGHIRNYQNIIDDLTGKDTALIDANEGLKSLEILTSIYKSASGNCPIQLPLKRE